MIIIYTLQVDNVSSKEKERKKSEENESAFSDFASSLLKIEEDDKEERVEILKTGVEDREKISKKTLLSSRAVTGQLSQIREEAGLSAFVGTSGKIKPPRLRKKEFTELLAREVLLIGRDELAKYGGLLSLDQLWDHFTATRENWEIEKNHVEDAVKYLEKEDMIPGIKKLDNIKLIQFKPVELSEDASKILNAAKGVDLTLSRLETLLGWSSGRVKMGLDQLASDGIAVIDGEDIYFPGL